MATLDRSRTSAFQAASDALDGAIEAALSGHSTHASGTTFIPADLAGSGHLDTYRRLGPVSIVDADGNQTLIPRSGGKDLVFIALVVGAALWLLARRPRVAA